MRTIFRILPLVVMITFMSCEKEKDSDVNAISEDEAADIVAMALAENSSGAVLVVETTTETTDKAINEESLSSESGLTLKSASTSACGFSHDTTFSIQNMNGTVITFDYSFSYSYSLTCNQYSIPESMGISYSYNGNFDAPRLGSNSSGNGSLTISGLELSAANYTFEGSYRQEGSSESKVRNQYTTSNSLEINFMAMVINKNTYKIEGGTASASLEGTVPQKGSFSFSCAITFNGDDTATVIINGNSYLIDLEDGEIIE